MTIRRYQSGYVDEAWIWAGEPDGDVSSNIPPRTASESFGMAASTAAQLVGVPLEAGQVVSRLTFVSGAAAMTTPTAWWFALYGPTDAAVGAAAGVSLLGSSVDQTNTAWAAETAVTLELVDPVTVTETGIYYAAIGATYGGGGSLAGVTAQAGAVGDLDLGYKVRTFTTAAATDPPPAVITDVITPGVNIPLVVAT